MQVNEKSPLADVELRLVDNLDEAMALKRWMGERREVLGVDTESDGFSAYAGKALRMVQFGDRKTGWAIPTPEWTGLWAELLNAYEGPLVFHNSTHDVPWLIEHGDSQKPWKPPWHRIHDSMTMCHLDDPTLPRALKTVADREIDPRASAGQQALHDGMQRQGWDWGTVPYSFAPYWVYGALDPVLTCHVWEKKRYVLDEFKYPYEIEMSATRIATNMKMHGMHVDVPYTEKAIASLRAYAGEIRGWLKSNYTVTSPMAGGPIAKVLEANEVPIQFWTDGGNPQFDKDALAFYAINYPQVTVFCQQIKAVRQAEKMIGTYLENFLSMRDSDDMIHASLWVNGTRSSRMSCSDPNLQNLIRDDNIVRGAFAPRPGNVFVSIDAAQIEARLEAHFSGDSGLIEAFRVADETGRDFFSVVASEVYQTHIEKKDPRRQRTKNTIYGKMYGAGVPKMALTAGVPVDQMQAFHDALIGRFPGIETFMRSSISEAHQNAHRGKPAVYTPTGRRLLLSRDKAYTSANYKIQGHAAEILKMGMARLDAAGYGPDMCFPVHDEVFFECEEDRAAELLHHASEVLADRKSYAVPILWEGMIMKERWCKG